MRNEPRFKLVIYAGPREVPIIIQALEGGSAQLISVNLVENENVQIQKREYKLNDASVK